MRIVSPEALKKVYPNKYLAVNIAADFPSPAYHRGHAQGRNHVAGQPIRVLCAHLTLKGEVRVGEDDRGGHPRRWPCEGLPGAAHQPDAVQPAPDGLSFLRPALHQWSATGESRTANRQMTSSPFSTFPLTQPPPFALLRVPSPSASPRRDRRLQGGMELVRLFHPPGWDVQAVMTESARKFVTTEWLRALTGHPVALGLLPRFVRPADESDASDLGSGRAR